GGLVGGSVSYALVRGGGSALAAILPAAVGAVVTGVAITLILPAMSGRAIGAGSAVSASVVGAALPVAGTLVVTHGALTKSTQGTLVFSGAGAVVTLAATVVGIAVTSWMVSSAALTPTGWRPAPGLADSAPAGEPADTPPPTAAAPLESGYWAAMERRTGS
ncbi:MAG: hypothetical protein ACTHNU_14060, partial [Gaiellales bacterium]